MPVCLSVRYVCCRCCIKDTSFTNSTLRQCSLRAYIFNIPKAIQGEFSLSEQSSFTPDPPLAQFTVQWAGVHFRSGDNWYVPFLTGRKRQRLPISKFYGCFLDSAALWCLCRRCNIHCATKQIPLTGWIPAYVTPGHFFGSTLGYQISFAWKNPTIILNRRSSRLGTMSIARSYSLPLADTTGGQARRFSCCDRSRLACNALVRLWRHWFNWRYDPESSR